MGWGTKARKRAYLPYAKDELGLGRMKRHEYLVKTWLPALGGLGS